MTLNLSRPLNIITEEYPEEKFFDIYIPTFSGDLRRITVPEKHKYFLYWLLDPESDHALEVLDQIVCEKPAAEGCTYAERLLQSLKDIKDDPTYFYPWCQAQRDRKYWLGMTLRADQDQQQKCRAWRETHSNFEPLPPAYD